MNAFFTALFYVFIAEIGDKTQLLTIAFTSKHKPLIVLCAVGVASLLVNFIAVALGALTGKFLPMFWINLFAGVAFVSFGLLELRKDDGEEEKERTSRWGPFFTIVLSFFIAEIGDKTMLATFAIASREQCFWQVWLGSTLGLLGSNVLAIVAGHFLRTVMPAQKLKVAVAAIYLLSGCLILSQLLAHGVG
jgi:Ca2+/H+ antiporter, TMEM165/GDT1 family